MILIAGGTGNLGRKVVSVLTKRQLPVRVLTRDPNRSPVQSGDMVELIAGNVRDRRSLDQAMIGVDTVISAVHGFTGTGEDSPETVDYLGNRNLITVAKNRGVAHVILISVHGAAEDHPMELFRMKFRAETELRASGLDWTIIRPTAYMETWATLIGEPLLSSGKTRIFGGGHNPINFVSVDDVARLVEQSVLDRTLRGEVIEVGGPECLTMRQVIETFVRVTGKEGSVSSVPLPMMRVMSVLMRPVNRTLARQIQAGVVMDTTDQTFDGPDFERRFPSLRGTSLADMVQRVYGNPG